MKFIVAYLLLINAISFLIMRLDKEKAKKNAWRISERTLLSLAALLGSIGILAGMKVFRHKTKHPKFTIGVPIMLAIQIVLGILVLILIKK